MLTKIVSSVISSFKFLISTLPNSSVLTKSTLNPCFCRYVKGPYIEECSNSVVIICLPLFLYFKHIPFIAVLFDSLEEDVYIISVGLIFKIFAILSVTYSSNS